MTTTPDLATPVTVDVEAHTVREARLEARRAVAVAANQADTLPDASQVCLDEVCGLTGWPVGHLYLAAGDGGAELLPTSVWHLDDPGRYQAFHHLSHLTCLTAGVGLPGQVLQDRRIVWIPDIAEWSTFPRAALAADLGLSSALGVPVLAGDAVVAVLEFFSTGPPAPDADLLALLDEVGHQLGRVAERARAAEGLRIGEERTRRILETAGDAFVTIDAGGRITAWNRQAEATFGWPAAEAVGRSLAETIVPERFREDHERGIARFLATGQATILRKRLELAALHRDGREVPIELTIWPGPAADGGSGHEFNAFLHDITERIADREALAQSEERFRLVFEKSQLGMAMVAPDQRILQVNDTWRRMLGYSDDEMEDGRMTFVDITHPDDVAESDERDSRMFAGETSGYTMEKRYRTATGAYIWAELTASAVRDRSGRLLYGLSIIEDITERRESEMALRESERQLVQAQRLAGIGSCSWDVRDGGGRWSDEFYRMCGLDPGGTEPTLASFLALIHPADRDRARLRVQTAHRTGVPFEFEHRVVLASGAERVFAVRGDVVKADGVPDRVTVMAQDITDRRAAEAALARYATEVAAANAELQAAHDLKDHFLAVTNHELRSPLTTILGFAAMLTQHWDGISDADKLESIARIEHQGRRLATLVEDLLTLSSMQAGSLELAVRPFEVAAVVDEAVLQSGLPTEQVIVSCPPGLEVTADFDRLTQILENYLTNAGKYGAPPYRVAAAAAPGWVELRVTDAGEGVPGAFVPHLFEKFVQASSGRSRRAKGSGLGLAIVEELARAHGGEAWYEPATPTGSCFGVRLPAPGPLG